MSHTISWFTPVPGKYYILKLFVSHQKISQINVSSFEILIGMAGCHHESYLDPFRHIQERVTNLLLGCRRRGTQVSFVILLRSGGSFPSSFVQSSIIKNS